LVRDYGYSQNFLHFGEKFRTTTTLQCPNQQVKAIRAVARSVFVVSPWRALPESIFLPSDRQPRQGVRFRLKFYSAMRTELADPIANALREDIGEGDVTTRFFVPRSVQGCGRIVTREKCILAGAQTAAEVFRRVDEKLGVHLLQEDGSALAAGATILEVRGRAASILAGERVALNFLQRLSGIATLTGQFVEAIKGYPAKILDTRKTMPGVRALEKAAVLAGGGENHRLGLDDMVLVKDNHVSANGGVLDFQRTIQRLRKERPDLRIELEADNLDQVRAFLEIDGVDMILLDNMNPTEMRKAIALRKQNKVRFEASGGVTLKNVRKIAATGVDYISVGALTHSARAIDLTLQFARAPE
jgi:nicotinate-nucleotide pyrophosphorylase (carboxylating)